MGDIINLIVQNGTAVVIIGYFIYKDATTQKTMIQTLAEIKDVLAVLKDKIK